VTVAPRSTARLGKIPLGLLDTYASSNQSKMDTAIRPILFHSLFFLSFVTLTFPVNAAKPVVDASKAMVTDPEASPRDLILTMPGWASGFTVRSE